MNKNKTYIIGHRGSSALFPENTRLSFLEALNNGYDGVELDVHQTKDNELVIIHDETTDRTSDIKIWIKDSTLKEIKKGNYGINFKSNLILGIKNNFKLKVPEIIMTFKEFLEEFGDKFEYINVEVKTDIVHYQNIEERVLKEIKNYRSKTNFILSSFNFKTIEILRELDLEISLGYLIYENESYKNFTDQEFLNVNNMCQYINVMDTLYLSDKKILDKFNLPYIIWQWRQNDEVGNYSELDKKNFDYFNKEKDIFGQIVDYKWD